MIRSITRTYQVFSFACVCLVLFQTWQTVKPVIETVQRLDGIRQSLVD